MAETDTKDDGKVEVKIGRNVEHDNVMYGVGTYRVTPEVARALQMKNATASVATYMQQQKAAEAKKAEQEAAAGGGDGGGSPSKPGVIIGGGSDAGEGAGGAGGAGGGASTSSPAGGASSGGSGGASGVESLTGELPADFPKRAELAAGNPDADPPVPPVTRYEELVKLSKEELDRYPGIGEASIEAIGQRLFQDAAKLSGGGGGQ